MEEHLHPDYRTVRPDDQGAHVIENMRHMFSDVAQRIEVAIPNNRQRSLALTHLETACMFAIKAVTRG